MRTPRFTVRRLMALVAIVAVGLVLYIRHLDFTERARRHAINEFGGASYAAEAREVPGFEFRVINGEKLVAYHGPLRIKYERAARYPWLPVAPDPPEPK